MKIGILGCGTMGGGIARRLSPNHSIFLYDRDQQKTEGLEKEGHGKSVNTLDQILSSVDLIFLSVKPQNLLEISEEMRGKLSPHQLLVSLLAGTTTDQLKKLIGHKKVVAMMPNLALLYGESSIGLTSSPTLTEEEIQNILALCRPLGKVYWLDEKKMNAFAALAGSGPAFVFSLIESMVQAGIEMGFTSKESQEISCQMIKGSLALLEQGKESLGEIKWKITSPEGTTIAGLRSFEEKGVRAGLIHTFLSTYKRGKEIEQSH